MAFRYCLICYTNLHSHPTSLNHAAFWALISKLSIIQAIWHNSKFFLIAHFVLLVVLAGHSPFLKVSKLSPIVKLNCFSASFSGTVAVLLGLLAIVACRCDCWAIWAFFWRDTLCTLVQGQWMANQWLGIYHFCIIQLSNFIGFVGIDCICWAGGCTWCTGTVLVHAWTPAWQSQAVVPSISGPVENSSTLLSKVYTVQSSFQATHKQIHFQIIM